MKFSSPIVLIGSICCLIVTINQLRGENVTAFQMNKTFQEMHFDHVQESSGEGLLVFDDDDKEKEFLDLLIVTKGKSPQRQEISIRFRMKLPWDEGDGEKKINRETILEKSFSNYFSDLLMKLGQSTPKVKFIDLKVKPTELHDFVHFNVNVECGNGNKSLVTVSECQAIVKRVAKKFNVKELLVYYHEMGYSANINPGWASILIKL